MATVYAAFRGKYSERQCMGIFTTREGAEACFSDAESRAGQVEEYELDRPPGKVWGRLWCAEIDLATGDVTGGHRYSWLHRPGRCRARFFGGEGPFGSTPRPFIAVESPVSLDHARKVAIERRQAWLRRQATLRTRADVAGDVMACGDSL